MDFNLLSKVVNPDGGKIEIYMQEEGTALNQTDFVQRNRKNSFSLSALSFPSVLISNCTRNS